MNRINELKNRGIRLGLDRITELMHLLGDPQDKLKFIHVAGTNGKGSVCTFISSMLAANGYRVGMYTSPAVADVREQYTINGEWISASAYADLAARVCAASMGFLSENSINPDEEDAEKVNEIMPTQFEYETAMAFLYFSEQNCDLVVLETGLGGRDDATNVVTTTLLSVLTSISEDHLGMIGDDLSEIALTKAGIIKEGVPVVMVSDNEEVAEVIRGECERLNAKLYTVNEEETPDFNLSARGAYQKQNAALALRAVTELGLNYEDIVINIDIARRALEETVIPFRMEKICDAPLFYLDGAHNPDAVSRLRDTIIEMFKGYTLIFIMGMFKDKDYREAVRIIVPYASFVYTVSTPGSDRALPADELRNSIVFESPEMRDRVCACDTIEEAVRESISKASGDDDNEHRCIIAFGSLSYLKYVRDIVVTSESEA